MEYRSQDPIDTSTHDHYHTQVCTPWASGRSVLRTWWRKASAVLIVLVVVLVVFTVVDLDLGLKLQRHESSETVRRLEVFSSVEPVSRVCVYNNAGIVLRWELLYERSKFTSVAYPVLQTRCIDGTHVHAPENAKLLCMYHDHILKPCAGHSYRYSGSSSLQGNYVCTGVALQVLCNATGVSPMY